MLNKYGCSLQVRRDGFFLVANGWIVSCYRGVNSKKRHFDVYPNIWRKTKTRMTNG